jgi:hypothetical protein
VSRLDRQPVAAPDRGTDRIVEIVDHRQKVKLHIGLPLTDGVDETVPFQDR